MIKYSNLLNIIKENIDVIEANLQKKFQCADKEYIITGNKDKLNKLSDMLWYIRYLKVRKEFKMKSSLIRIPMRMKIKKNGVFIIEKVYWYYINNKKIKQYNFKLGNIKGAKTLWKK